ncbi:MAG TPA: lysylphosphatidylglycerol synthase transmembrane domain-containing protein [Planctomycetota bacterium]|nr:lysylphosphatidylglycerol synthase transmembrane domain-containing protein [Planctomycetota bacterium]
MWKKVLFAASLLFGLGLFVFVIAHFGGIKPTMQTVAEVGWLGLAVFIANASVVLIAPAIGWTMLMRGEGMKIPLSTALKACFMGFPINFLAPSMYLGAEPLKMFYVASAHGEPKRRVLATIIVSKFQEVGALLLVMLVAAGIALWRIPALREKATVLVTGMAVLSVLFGLTLYAFLGNFRPTVRIINLLAALGMAKRKLARLRRHAREMEQLIHRSFTHKWRTFLASQAVTLISAVSILMRPWIFFWFARERVWIGAEYLCGIYVVTNLINMVPHTPGGLGIFEAGMVGVFKLANIQIAGDPKSAAAAFSIMTRAADLVLILVGIYLIVHFNMQAIARRTVKGQEKIRVTDAELANGANDRPKT